MNSPVLSVVGHTTLTTSRVQAVFDDPTIEVARLAYAGPGRTGVVDAKVAHAPPYGLARFALEGLSAGQPVEYRIAGAAKAEDLPPEAQLQAAPRRLPAGGTFRTLPAPSERPLRFAVVSCNGVHSSPDVHRYRLWKALAAQIEAGNVDLVLFAGDQIYADPIWMKHDAHASLRGLAPAAATERLVPEYRKWYVRSWSPPEIQAVLGGCPSLMMWDDHDIYDGYGSNDDDGGEQAQAYFRAAKQAFAEFQAANNPVPLGPSSFACAFDVADVGFLLLDGRSNRSYGKGHVLGGAQLHLVDQHLKALAGKRLKHLYVVAAVPFVHAPVAAALAIFDALPGTEGPLDDLRDSWAAPNNLGEARRVLLSLFNFAKESGTPVTVVSGDVHVATIGAIESHLPAHRGGNGTPTRIHQVVASGIGHTPPTGRELWILKKGIGVADGCIRLAGKDVVGQLLPFQGSPDRYLLARRNFAIVKMSDAGGRAFDPHGNLWVEYVCEEGDEIVVREQCLMRQG